MAAKKDVQKQDIEARRHKVLQLRRKGKSLRAIGLEVGVSYQQVADDLKNSLAALHATTVEHAQTLREIELARIDSLIEKANEVLENGDDDKILPAMDRVLRLSQERSKLLGLYAPEQIKSEITYHIVDETE